VRLVAYFATTDPVSTGSVICRLAGGEHGAITNSDETQNRRAAVVTKLPVDACQTLQLQAQIECPCCLETVTAPFKKGSEYTCSKIVALWSLPIWILQVSRRHLQRTVR